MSEATSRLITDETDERIAQLECALTDTQNQTNRVLEQIWARLEQLQPPDPRRNPTKTSEATVEPPIPHGLPTPNSLLKPSMPNDFDGSRDMGKAFLMSCKLYFDLCANQFPNDQTRIHWVLSFMKSGRAATFAQYIYNRQSLAEDPVFETWKEFEKEFRTRFCPRDEATAAMNKLEGTAYYQGNKPVDEYIDQFEELVAIAGYAEGRVIVMKFRKGLDVQLQNRIAEMGVDRPADYDPGAWYEAARRFDANRAANRAFNATGRRAPPPVPNSQRPAFSLSRQVNAPPQIPAPRPTHQQPPAPFLRPQAAGPVPMDVDTLRKKRPLPGTCYRCGSAEHLVKDCPLTLDVRSIPVEEQEAMLEQLMAAADIRAAEMAQAIEDEGEQEGLEEVDNRDGQEGFGPCRR